MQHAFAMLFSFLDKTVFVWAVTDPTLLHLFLLLIFVLEMHYLTTCFSDTTAHLEI